jgi:putative endonuclease
MPQLWWQSGAKTDPNCGQYGRVKADIYSVYMLRCADGSLYTGIATDVSRRLQEHQSSPRGAKYLRGRGPLTLEFQQAVGDRGDASKVEYLLKNLAKVDKEEIVSGRKSLAELTARLQVNQASGTGGG